MSADYRQVISNPINSEKIRNLEVILLQIQFDFFLKVFLPIAFEALTVFQKYWFHVALDKLKTYEAFTPCISGSLSAIKIKGTHLDAIVDFVKEALRTFPVKIEEARCQNFVQSFSKLYAKTIEYFDFRFGTMINHEKI